MKATETFLKNPNKNWFARPVDEALGAFDVERKIGLSQEGVGNARSRFGPNALPHGKKDGPVLPIARQFINPLVIILLIAASLTFFIKEYIDFTVIILAVFVNVGIGFWQEYKSNQIFEKLDKLVRVNARVRRDGKLFEIDMSELVPGDIIILHGDMKVPADARLLYANNLTVNEALLTGESESRNKEIVQLPEETVLGDRVNMVHMGTVIEEGEGEAVVVATGANTEIGNIASLTLNVKNDGTPLQERLSKLGKKISVFVTLFAVIIFTLGLTTGEEITELFKVAVAVAVAAIPEGLPAALSVVLAVSATRILKRKGLVKRLIGAETLGSTTVIVTDKTGTLTTGHMSVEELIESNNPEAARLSLYFSSDVTFVQNEEGKDEFRGESTDKAKVEYFTENGGNVSEAEEKFTKCAFLPFNQDKKIIISFRKTKGKGIVFMSGAHESVTNLCNLSDEEKQRIHSSVESYAERGFRMIAVAQKYVDDAENWNCNDSRSLEGVASDMKFLGVAALRDPIREDVKEAMITTREAGVRVIMATGDHKLTARSIGSELGFNTANEYVITGSEIGSLDEQELKERLQKVEIFARVTPAHKMRLMEVLKDSGEVVAMTGDGVNDAPALKASDIGVALDSGSDITKETADLILMDNSFSIITEAIREGRIAFSNIRKVAVFLLSNSFTEIIVILAAIVFNTSFLPITAVMILWANLVEDTFPNFALAFEPGEPNIMKQPPISEKEPILDKQGLAIIFIIGILSDLMLVGIFGYLLNFTDFTPEHIQTIIFTILATNSLFIVFAIKSHDASIFKTKMTDNPYLLFAVGIGLIIMGLSIYAPPLQALLGTVPLSGMEIVYITIILISQVLLIEAAKWFFRRGNILGFDNIPGR